VSSRPVPADVRVVAATHRDLSKLVEEGSFREDLFYRINVMRLELPSLRERREDIPLLIDHFIDRFNRLQEKNIAAVSDDVLALLMSHDFPLDHLPAELTHGRQAAEVRPRTGATLQSMEALHIADALRRQKGNRKAAAEELGIHPSTLFRKIRDLEIEVPRGDGRRRGE